MQGFPYPKPSPTPEGRKASQEDVIGANSIRSMAKRVAEMTKIIKAGLGVVPEKELAWPLKPKVDMAELYKKVKK